MNRTLWSPRPAEVVLSEKAELASFIGAQSGMFRTYSPSYSLPQQTAAHFEIRLADGVDPLYLETYSDFMEDATGVERTGYSVSVPPLEVRDPHSANTNARPDPAMLGLLNVKYVVSEFEIADSQLQLVDEIDGSRVYENLAVLPRAWLSVRGEPPQAVADIQELGNSRVLKANGPGLLVYSEVYYPGWQVAVDGEPMPLTPVEGLLLGVELGAGTHQVEFRFSPRNVYLGAAMTIGAFLAILALAYTRVGGFFGICNASER
ncbi:MAG TPA: YfhO family protein [Anaerolineales bacterium]|nr:YfhO family protein [Anaerolineales bacterium]